VGYTCATTGRRVLACLPFSMEAHAPTPRKATILKWKPMTFNYENQNYYISNILIH